MWIAEGFPYPLTPETTSPLEAGEPLISERWKDGLKSHPDKTYVNTIFRIIEFGAKIGYRGYQGPKTLILSENLTSANDDPDTLTKDLKNQVSHGRVTKLEAPWKNFIFSPLGLAPKLNGRVKTHSSFIAS